MRHCKSLTVFWLALASFFYACEPVLAQWQVPNYSVPIGRGTGTGFKSAAPGTAGFPLVSQGASSNPGFGSIVSGALPSPFTNGTASGNTSSFATTSGSLTSGDCVEFDASGNLVASGGSCGSSTSGVITPEQFGAAGDGTTDDSVAFNNMCNYATVSSNGVNTISFAYGKTYMIWKAATGTPASTILCNLSGVNGLTVQANGAVLTTDNTFTGGTAGYLYVFYMSSGANITLNNIRYTQSVKTTLDSANGGVAVSISGTASRVIINNINTNNAAFGVWTSVLNWETTTGPYNIAVNGGSFSTTYYPLSFGAAGDNFTGRNINCNNVGRCYFAWNVHNHDVQITSSFGGTFNDIEVHTFCDSTATTERNSTSNIKVVYRNPERYNNISADSLVRLSMMQNTAIACSDAQLRNIDIQLDVNQSTNSQPIGVKTYKLTSASTTDNTPRGYVVENISISGVVQNYNSGNAVLDLFNASNGDFAGDTLRNIIVRDFVATGSSSSVSIDAVGISSNLLIENVVSNVTWTITNAAANVLSYKRAAIAITAPTPMALGGEGGPVYQGQVAILGVNFNSANTDYCTTIPLPPQVTRWKLNAITISGASASLASATMGVYTDPSAGGTALMTPGTAVTVTTAADSTANNFQVSSGIATISNTDVTPCFRVGTASSGAATANVQINYTTHP